MKEDSLLLYLVTDRHWTKTQSLEQQVEEAIKAGVTFVQLREKDLDKQHIIEEARKIQKICKKYQVPFVINDYVDIAKEIDADGVHLGQGDMLLEKARDILGKDKIIGISAGNVEEAQIAQSYGADYLGVGAVFSTTSKDDAQNVDINTLKQITQSVEIPVIAIGGINENNINQLKDTGIVGVAVISAILASDSITDATKILYEKVKQL